MPGDKTSESLATVEALVRSHKGDPLKAMEALLDLVETTDDYELAQVAAIAGTVVGVEVLLRLASASAPAPAPASAPNELFEFDEVP